MGGRELMKKVKMSEIKKHAKGELSIENLGIEINKYLPILTKQALVNLVIENSTIEENGINKINHAIKQMTYELLLVRYYSNIDFSIIDKAEDSTQKLIEFYDLLKESGVIDYIISNIPKSEINFLNGCLRKQVKQEENMNSSFVVVIGQFLNNLLDKIPDEKGMIEIAKQLQNIDTKKFEWLNKAIDWNNGDKNGN